MRFNGRSTPPPAPAAPRYVARVITLPDFAELEEQQDVVVEFAEPFPVPPVVTTTPLIDDPFAAAATADQITEDGFVLHASRVGGGLGFEVSWQAVEPTPDAVEPTP